jgi:DGQHR domain-containing protein
MGGGEMNENPYPIDRDTIVKKIRAFKAQQPIGDLFFATVDFKLIQQMTYFDVRRRLQEERDVERYLGIQRPLNKTRVKDLMQYVNFIDATFPTSIILAVESDYVSYDEKRLELTISNTKTGNEKPDIAFRNLFRVIDGQHRIAGLEGFAGENFDVLVSLFVGSDIADQAHVFATVNLEQTKVGKSLAMDLFELARTRSPIKTCHNIAVALDTTTESPFFHRIKRLGVATQGRVRPEAGPGETLTQATFVNALIRYISDDPKLDRDRLLRGETLPFVVGEEEERLCFRNMFIREKDIQIGKIVEQYFLAVQERWPDAWDAGGKGYMLNQANGFRALMRVFGEAYIHLASPGQFVDAKRFLELFNRVDVEWNHFTIERYKPGSSGEARLREFLRLKIFDEE